VRIAERCNVDLSGTVKSGNYFLNQSFMIPGGARMTAAIAKRVSLLGRPVLARRFTCLFAVIAVAVMVGTPRG
jgi:hypothetical protein